jgi:hypothetical protein
MFTELREEQFVSLPAACLVVLQRSEGQGRGRGMKREGDLVREEEESGGRGQGS